MPRIDVLCGFIESSVMPCKLSVSIVGRHALADCFHHLTELYEFITDYLIVVIKSELGNIAFSKIKIPCTLLLGGVGGTNHTAKTFTEILKTCTDCKTVIGESTLASSIDDLKEELPHCGIDSVANEVGIESLKYGLAGKDLGSHCCGMSHTAAAYGLNKSFLDDTVLNVKGELASSLLRCAPADTMGETAYIGDLLGIYLFAFFGYGRGLMICALAYTAHIFNFLRVFHLCYSFLDTRYLGSSFNFYFVLNHFNVF